MGRRDRLSELVCQRGNAGEPVGFKFVYGSAAVRIDPASIGVSALRPPLSTKSQAGTTRRKHHICNCNTRISETATACILAKIIITPASLDYDPTEVAIPWRALSAVGHEVYFATPDGQRAFPDELMLTGESLHLCAIVPGQRREIKARD